MGLNPPGAWRSGAPLREAADATQVRKHPWLQLLAVEMLQEAYKGVRTRDEKIRILMGAAFLELPYAELKGFSGPRGGLPLRSSTLRRRGRTSKTTACRCCARLTSRQKQAYLALAERDLEGEEREAVHRDAEILEEHT
jgi:hypothetical protein